MPRPSPTTPSKPKIGGNSGPTRKPRRKPAVAALAQARESLRQARETTREASAVPGWSAAASQHLSDAIDRIYYAISNSPELPHDDHPWEVSISRPDGIPYALTKLFRLQELLQDRFRINPEETAELPPGNPAADEEKQLLEEAAAELEAVIRHWQSPTGKNRAHRATNPPERKNLPGYEYQERHRSPCRPYRSRHHLL